ncbi:unknown [Acidaminococcus sp. CAG:542]|nr:unknown [Acidaminococcus sp. CAG:542]
MAKTLKIVLDTPLLREDGTLTPESEKMLAQGLDHVSLQ